MCMRHCCAVGVTKIFRLNISVGQSMIFQLRMQGSFFLMKETAEDINKATFKAQLHQDPLYFGLRASTYSTKDRFHTHLQQASGCRAFKNMTSSVHWTNTAVPLTIVLNGGTRS